MNETARHFRPIPDMTPKQWLSNIRRTWGQITQVAVFILGVLGSFLLPPPGWVSAGGSRTIVRLAQFIVAVLVGLIFLLIEKWSKRKHVVRWVLAAIGCLVLSIGAFFAYQHFLDSRTCQYDRQVIVTGTHYTPHGQEYVNENPNSTCTNLLEDFAGKAEDIWTKDSIDRSRYLLALVYILNLPLFTICLVAVIQALQCAKSKARH